MNCEVPRATIGRIPLYLKYLKTLPYEIKYISATSLAKELGLGEVKVRKDLSIISGAGKPKIGYSTTELIKSLENFIDDKHTGGAIIVGAGRLGRTLLDYSGFDQYGLKISAAFDINLIAPEKSDGGKNIFPINLLDSYCEKENVKIGIITVPESSAQKVCDNLVKNNIKAIWNFAPCSLTVPANIPVRYENMALSLAYLNQQIKITEDNYE